MIFHIVSGALLALAFVTDITKQKIPNYLTASGCIIGVLLHWWLAGISGAAYALLGTALGFIPLFILYLINAVGAGDVKLFAALGALVGTEFVLQSVMYSLIYAALISCVILLCRWEWEERGLAIMRFFSVLFLVKDRRLLKSLTNSKEHLRFPFMWAVAPAAVTAYLQSI
ncbi:A24 family peptidase [Paenibacillus xerothermodurans]|nr:A24 family peptidase [Paenibacillus xerothermodurans]